MAGGSCAGVSPPTATPTATATATLAVPRIDGGVERGDDSVSGDGEPNCATIQVCLIGPGGTLPSVPPCTAPDSILGSGPSDANGNFDIMIAPPLNPADCIYAYDTCDNLVGPTVCAFLPAPAPALSPRMTLLAISVLGLVALIGMLRLRRDT